MSRLRGCKRNKTIPPEEPLCVPISPVSTPPSECKANRQNARNRSSHREPEVGARQPPPLGPGQQRQRRGRHRDRRHGKRQPHRGPPPPTGQLYIVV